MSMSDRCAPLSTNPSLEQGVVTTKPSWPASLTGNTKPESVMITPSADTSGWIALAMTNSAPVAGRAKARRAQTTNAGNSLFTPTTPRPSRKPIRLIIRPELVRSLPTETHSISGGPILGVTLDTPTRFSGSLVVDQGHQAVHGRNQVFLVHHHLLYRLVGPG